MKHITANRNATDGLDLFFRRWEPDEKPKAVICLIHGLGEHSGRYEHVAQAMTNAGFAFCAFDLRGHGRSGGKRGHFGSLDLVLEDIDLLRGEAKNCFPNLPEFLYGHSLGGILTLYYILKRNPELTGVIATSSGLHTSLEEQKGKLLLTKILGAIAPELSLPTGLDSSGLSHDPNVAAVYDSDPLVHGQATVAFANNILKAIDYTFEHACECELPLLIMHGTDDPVAYAKGSVEFAGAAPNARLKLWEGMYHETHNEIERDQVIDYIISWLNERLSQPEVDSKSLHAA